VVSGIGIAVQVAVPEYTRVLNLEDTSEDSANVGIGDLDGDGDLDLALAKGRHTPLVDRVLLNDGSGKFTATDLGPADRTYSAVLADLDGDRDVDIAISNDRPDTKVIYLNDGKGRFRAAGTWGAPEWSTRNAAAADLNGDGKPDIIAANRPGPSFVCLNDGNGTFTAPCVAIPAGSATSIIPADFDNDGHIDLAVPERDGGQSRIYFNDGKAHFTRTLPFGTAKAAARVGSAADFDGDDDLDLVVGDEAAALMVVYINDGKGNLHQGFRFQDRARVPYALTTGDLNHDNRPDIVIGYVSARPAVFFNSGNGSQFTAIEFGDGKGSAYGFALGDLDGDGAPDIAHARSGAPNVVYFSKQSAPAAATGRSFDVASIKRNTNPDGPRFFNSPGPGRVSLINQTVRQIIGNSHQIQDYQIIGGPEWLRTDRFDIEATADGGPAAPQMLMMVRALLADRFQLRTHPEQRELPVFHLTYARAGRRLGPELKPSRCRPVGAKPDDSQTAVCGNQVGRNVMALRGTTMRGLANQLGRLPVVGRPVIDVTGLTDPFDIQLTWSFDPVADGDSPAGAQPDATSIFTALEEQLGLKLESSRGPVDVIVIDSAQPPSEN
jgi:uncharacterized protein (TIGR03435 family)